MNVSSTWSNKGLLFIYCVSNGARRFGKFVTVTHDAFADRRQVTESHCAMDVGAARGMLRRPVGLLPTVLERAGQRGASAQSGLCSGVQAMATEPCVQTQVEEMLPRAAIAAVTPNADAMEMLPRVAIAVATPAAEAMFSTLPLAAVVRVVDKGEEAFACPRETVSLLGLPLGVLAANGILARGEVSATLTNRTHGINNNKCHY